MAIKLINNVNSHIPNIARPLLLSAGASGVATLANLPVLPIAIGAAIFSNSKLAFSALLQHSTLIKSERVRFTTSLILSGLVTAGLMKLILAFSLASTLLFLLLIFLPQIKNSLMFYIREVRIMKHPIYRSINDFIDKTQKAPNNPDLIQFTESGVKIEYRPKGFKIPGAIQLNLNSPSRAPYRIVAPKHLSQVPPIGLSEVYLRSFFRRTILFAYHDSLSQNQ